jgi:hypothetical protein
MPRTKAPFDPADCPPFVTRSSIAASLGIDPSTLVRWERAGLLPRAIRIGLGRGRCVYRREGLLPALARLLAPVPAEGGPGDAA